MHPPLALFIQIRENSQVCFLLKQVNVYSQSKSISTVVIGRKFNYREVLQPSIFIIAMAYFFHHKISSCKFKPFCRGWL